MAEKEMERLMDPFETYSKVLLHTLQVIFDRAHKSADYNLDSQMSTSTLRHIETPTFPFRIVYTVRALRHTVVCDQISRSRLLEIGATK